MHHHLISPDITQRGHIITFIWQNQGKIMLSPLHVVKGGTVYRAPQNLKNFVGGGSGGVDKQVPFTL